MNDILDRLIFNNEKILENAVISSITPKVYIVENKTNNRAIIKEFSNSDTWGHIPDTHTTFYIPLKKMETKFFDNIALKVSTGTTDDDWNVCNPQFLAYVDGKEYQALDSNHRELYFDENKDYEVYLEGYNGLKFSAFIKMQIEQYEYDKNSIDFYYIVKNLLEILDFTELNSKQYSVTVNSLNRIFDKIDFTERKSAKYYQDVLIAKQELENLVSLLKDDFNPTAYSVGSSHLDVAWLWTFEQTKEKAQRTVATALRYMDMFPDYKFFASQSLLYKYVKTYNPQLFARVKERIKEGRWDAEGATFVEPDCNLISGESFIRQILFGQNFYKKEFDVDSHICYIPDSFGFSGAFPQILKKCGIDLFITSKISWNDTKKFPYDLFTWKGIDGSEITTYFITSKKTDKITPQKEVYGKESREKLEASVYGAFLQPDYVAGAYENFKQKNLSDDFLVVYGYSDGGGGPTFKHIKSLEVLSNGIRNCPKTKFATLSEFAEKLQSNIQGKQLDVYKGELYLQLHRGTLTSIAKCKRNNRLAEREISKLEFISSLNSVLFGKEYAQEKINAIWEKILINQFHDVLPGSSIYEQYQITEEYYREVFEEIDLLLKENYEYYIERTNYGKYLVFNNNSFAANDYVVVDGKYYYVEDIPPKGFKSVDLVASELKHINNPLELENQYYKISFNENYQIVSIFDKRINMELVKEGYIANDLTAYEDLPHVYDAWEIKAYYKDKFKKVDDLISANFYENGGKFGYVIKRKFNNSIIQQTISLFDNKEGIYFENEIEWEEEHVLLRTHFPVNISSDRATYDIQFGQIERPTTFNNEYETAMFEVCGHKFVDYSNREFGISLLNDCKYGYDVHDDSISLTLLKCATDPNPFADKGHHEFTYVLYPHKDILKNSNVLQAAYLLNNPLTVITTNQQAMSKGKYSFVEVSNDKCVIETIKQAEDSSGIIIRVYEPNGIHCESELIFDKDIKSAQSCNLVEKETENCNFTQNKIAIKLKPFEIITLKLNF